MKRLNQLLQPMGFERTPDKLFALFKEWYVIEVKYVPLRIGGFAIWIWNRFFWTPVSGTNFLEFMECPQYKERIFRKEAGEDWRKLSWEIAQEDLRSNIERRVEMLANVHTGYEMTMTIEASHDQVCYFTQAAFSGLVGKWREAQDFLVRERDFADTRRSDTSEELSAIAAFEEILGEQDKLISFLESRVNSYRQAEELAPIDLPDHLSFG